MNKARQRKLQARARRLESLALQSAPIVEPTVEIKEERIVPLENNLSNDLEQTSVAEKRKVGRPMKKIQKVATPKSHKV